MLHLLLMLVQVVHVIAKGLLSSDSSRNVLQLLLHELFGLSIVEVVKTQRQVLLVALTLVHINIWILLLESVVLLLHHVHVLVPPEVVVFLQHDGIVLVLREVQDGLKVLLVKVLVLELFDHDVSLLGFTEARQEDVQIVLNLLN